MRADAVLFDRDGTLIVDVPYNGDPARVEPVDDALSAVDRLRSAGIPVGVISNQGGIAAGVLTAAQVDAVNARMVRLLGPLDPVLYCPHGPDDGCACRKPEPGMVLAAAERLGLRPRDCVVIGDIACDVDAARAAGARGILVPTPATSRADVDAAPEVAPDLTTAVGRLLDSPGTPP